MKIFHEFLFPLSALLFIAVVCTATLFGFFDFPIVIESPEILKSPIHWIIYGE